MEHCINWLGCEHINVGIDVGDLIGNGAIKMVSCFMGSGCYPFNTVIWFQVFISNTNNSSNYMVSSSK